MDLHLCTNPVQPCLVFFQDQSRLLWKKREVFFSLNHLEFALELRWIAGSEKRMHLCRAETRLLLLIGHAYTHKVCSTELSITYFTTGVEVRICRVNDSITVDCGNVSLNNLQLQQVNKCVSTMLVKDPEQDLHLCTYQHPSLSYLLGSKICIINHHNKA